MKFYSTNKKSGDADLTDAVFRGLAPDGGLFMPQHIPRLPATFLNRLRSTSFQEIAFRIASAFFGEDVPEKMLRDIVKRSINFDAPLVRLDGNTYVLELFHGPTLSFKDFGARFMAQLLAYLTKKSRRKITVLTATSGDTGSAVAQGFLGAPGIRVVVLYPKGKVTNVQESQMATLGRNIRAVAVRGTFDDCQALVKRAFRDRDLNRRLGLTSANSVNIARLIPQIFYYFRAYAQLPRGAKRAVFSVPSGNFGNLTAGLMAKKMGLPARFVAATNVNDAVPEYLRTGLFRPRPSKQTLANAMDVGNPSNFARMLDLYGRDRAKMKNDVWGAAFTDEEMLGAMREVFNTYRYTLDPHGAVGFLGLKKYRSGHAADCAGIILETAHPSKFPGAVEASGRAPLPMPPRLKKYMSRKKRSVVMPNDFSALIRMLQK
ncbi:MAG TPA: threonine synthase [Candidatus Paceibacterota bacterium]|nr:threonine synthase [Candidatus Paceibacterota bacterium]